MPRGVGNGFQTLEPNTVYTYLVNDHYSPGAAYTSLHPWDETLAIDWPIPLERAELSAKDRAQGSLSEVVPIPPLKTLVIGAGGQLGRALRAAYADAPHIEFADRADLDLCAGDLDSARRDGGLRRLINAAAYTAVDAAETAAGRAAAWAANVTGVAALARIATAHALTVVHISSDYVFDGSATRPYREDDPPAPLGVYRPDEGGRRSDRGQRAAPLHRADLVGDRRGPELRAHHAVPGAAGDRPAAVVDDQYGRLTFTAELAEAIRHLTGTRAPYGTYHVSNAGPVRAWSDVARQVFTLAGHDPDRVRGVLHRRVCSATQQVRSRPPGQQRSGPGEDRGDRIRRCRRRRDADGVPFRQEVRGDALLSVPN